LEDGYSFGIIKHRSRDAPHRVADEGYLQSLVSAARGFRDFSDDIASRPCGGSVWRRVPGIDVAYSDAGPPAIGIPCLVSIVGNANKHIHLRLMSKDSVPNPR
jgi:hypothetical protein